MKEKNEKSFNSRLPNIYLRLHLCHLVAQPFTREIELFETRVGMKLRHGVSFCKYE